MDIHGILHRTSASVTKPSRSLIACSLCRKLKVKCSGPGNGPCTRCVSSRSNCTFIPPEPTAEQPVSTNPESIDANERIAHLEMRLKGLESTIDAFRSTQVAVERISAHIGLPEAIDSDTTMDRENTTAHILHQTVPNNDDHPLDLISKRLLSEVQCRHLYDFFKEKCSEAIAFFDNTSTSFEELRQSPLLLAATCTIGARACASELYDTCLKEFYSLAQDTLLGPTPTLDTLKGILLMSVWHRNSRLWGLALSISYQLRLPEVALGLQIQNADMDEIYVDQARTWLSFCCMDLGRHINENYFISDLGRYTSLGKHLLNSPFRRSVDYRIDAYLEVFQIASHARRNFQLPNNIMSEPISSENMELLEKSNQKLNSWFHRHSTDVDPIYQSYSKPQDRNRMKIPYNLVRMYTNGYVLHGLKQGTSEIHPLRLHFIKLTVGAGVELLSCAIQSMNYQLTLKYSIDYSDSSLGAAIKYLLHACRVAYHHLDCNEIIGILEKAHEMFTNANLDSKARELSSALEQLAQTIAVPLVFESSACPSDTDTISEYNSWDTPDWLASFRLPLSDFSLDEASLQNIFLYSGE